MMNKNFIWYFPYILLGYLLNGTASGNFLKFTDIILMEIWKINNRLHYDLNESFWIDFNIDFNVMKFNPEFQKRKIWKGG